MMTGPFNFTGKRPFTVYHVHMTIIALSTSDENGELSSLETMLSSGKIENYPGLVSFPMYEYKVSNSRDKEGT